MTLTRKWLGLGLTVALAACGGATEEPTRETGAALCEHLRLCGVDVSDCEHVNEDTCPVDEARECGRRLRAESCETVDALIASQGPIPERMRAYVNEMVSRTDCGTCARWEEP